MINFIQYPKCSTCKKALQWLESKNIEFNDIDIKTNNPNFEYLKAMHEKSGLPLKSFFNTSGLLYKSMGLKDKLPNMSEEEQLELLATDGMLVKRPILEGDGFVLTGFKAEKWAAALGVEE